MSKLIKILMLVVLGLVLGTGTTFFLLQKASAKFAQQIAARKAANEAAKIPDKPWDFWTIALEELSNDLKDERARLKVREEQLKQREERLVIDGQELEKTRKQVETMRAMIDQKLIEVGEGEAVNLKKLSQSYSLLKPSAAVAIFKEMEDATLVKLLSIMKPDSVATILDEMSRQAAIDPNVAKRAAQLSEKLRLVKPAKTAPAN